MDTSQGDYDELGEEEAILELEGEPSFPVDILKLEHNFGFDCKRLFNLVQIDHDTLIFASGNYLNFFSISRRQVTFKETTLGCGIGFITRNEHPDHYKLLTVGENGATPTIFIYEWPSQNIYIKLMNAAKSCFTAGTYNSTGEFFASQAGYPDFIITIWRWEKAEVVLRSKSFQNDILFVHFSVHNPILLVSSGLCHIKFWKMANTFTGLKLKGDLGRFGKTDFSDIYATYMLSDENVISGCEWGNMLLWEAGLIKFEICRKGRKPCHTRPITRITMRNGEVTTVGMDGYVRVWFWETVDIADPPEDDLFVEIDPIYEFKIADVELRAMQKIHLFNDDDYTYYAQDGNGGIWFCDINVNDVPQKPKQLYSCVGGRVIAAETSSVSPHLMTLSETGKIFAYDYDKKKLLLEKQFPSNGIDLLWFDMTISKSGMELMAGFEDGIIRQLFLDLSDIKSPSLHLVNAIKGHTAPITKMTVNDLSTLLLTGAMDKSIFIYALDTSDQGLILLRPLGFVEFQAIPYCFHWHPREANTVLIGSKTGEVYQYQLRTDVTEEETYLSYNLTEPSQMRSTKFVSVKSRIRREIKREKIKRRKEKKRQRKIREIEKLKKANPGLQIDMEGALADSEPDEEEEPLHIPAVPNPILWLMYTDRGTIWVSMAGYDAGYIYELEFDMPEPSICTLIVDGDDIEIPSYLIIEDFYIFGLINGKLRINRKNIGNFTDLSEYRLYPMHDKIKGRIPKILPTYNGQHIITIGHDGNVFLFKWNGPEVPRNAQMKQFHKLPHLEHVKDILEDDYPSLEQEKINAEIRRQEEAAAAHDRDVLQKIGELQKDYFEIVRINKELPEDLRVTDKDLLMDARITKQIRDELQAELDDVREDLAYDLEFAQVGHQKLYNHFLKDLDHLPFKVSCVWGVECVESLRLQALGEEYEQIKRDIEERLRREQILGLKDLIAAEEKSDSMGEPPIEKFFFGRDSTTITPRFSRKMMRLLIRYRGRQWYEVKRTFDWDKLERQRPDPNRNHPDDDAKINEAKRNLGDYKLKMGVDFEPKANDTLTNKYIEIVKTREAYFELLNEFNNSLFTMREKKKKLYEYINSMTDRLYKLHEYLPKLSHIYMDKVPPIAMEEEYPEFNLVEHYQPGCGVNIDDILYLEKTAEEAVAEKSPQTNISDETDDDGVVTDSQDFSELLKYRALRVSEIEALPTFEDLFSELKVLPAASDIKYYEPDSEEQTPILLELRYRWLLDLFIEQEKIKRAVEERIQQFDSELKKLHEYRFVVRLNAEFMSAYMISLNQELYILRDSEEIENQLLLNANVAMNTRNELQLVINAVNRQMDDLRKSLDRLDEQIQALRAKFLTTIKGHKFFDFLRRIFKKRWRPPKPPKKDDESSESSSSDSSSSEDEEADTKSIDSLDMTTIRLDEATCPSGLERSMYELAFKMRSERHEMERTVMETQHDIEKKRREIAEMQKQMKFHEEVYNRERNTLTEFRRSRQHETNKVLINVVLRMDQLQHFYEGDDYRDLSKAVLFDSNMLTSLRNRVKELSEETLATKRWHRINIVHLRRMKTDIKFMRYEITRLEEEIRQAMMKRFGLIINLDELEEEVLRRYVFELETTAEDELRALEKELRQKELELAQCEEDQVRETQINTEKLNVLTVLREEKNSLQTIIDMQEKNYSKWSKPPPINLLQDIEKLLSIDKRQKEQIECLEREICTLRMKTKPMQLEDTESVKDLQASGEPSQEPQICPAILNVDAYMLPRVPDDFIMERIHTLVQKSFVRFFGSRTSEDNVRRYAQRASLYLGQAAYNFEGKMTDRILECITEHLQIIVPKKYFIHISADDLRKLFNEILAIFDYERSDVNTEDVVSGIFDHAKDSLCANLVNVVNRTQYIVTHMFRELIEVLPLEEFQSEETQRVVVKILEREPMVDPRAIAIEDLIESTMKHARENLIDGITIVPVRKLITGTQRELLKRRQYKPPHCTQSEISISVAARKLTGNIF